MGQVSAALRRSSNPTVDEGGGYDGETATQSQIEADAASRGLLAGLQSVGWAAALLDRRGALVAANALARPFAGLLDAPALGCPSGRSRSVQHRIRDVLESASRETGCGHAGATVIALPDGSMMVVRATALGTADPGLFRRASVLVLFAALGLDRLPDPDLLRGAFGLTATETEVALALVGGASASAIARARAVSLETVRSQLKTIFAKTGTRRQAHLVALILQLRDAAPAG